jgi:hypothetical protein
LAFFALALMIALSKAEHFKEITWLLRKAFSGRPPLFLLYVFTLSISLSSLFVNPLQRMNNGPALRRGAAGVLVLPKHSWLCSKPM